MKDLQPSRSIGKIEKAIPLGVLHKIEIEPENTIACFGCDGIEDNEATNENNFGRFVVNFENANKEFFENDNPIVLELACGAAAYTIALAERFPDKNFLGVDIKGSRIWNGAYEAREKGLKNAGFLRIHIENIEQYFEEHEVDEIWITFPDPQPRKSKAKKRLSSPRFLKIYHYLLKKGGFINFKTDDLPLFDFSVESAKEENLIIHEELRDIYGTGVTDPLLVDIQTKYEKSHIADGRLIYFMKSSFE